ncbi:tyrosine-type recombinase/integrase [Microbispora catharanthi]|uniref:Tyrosine-type recombinase/integrase n=2 Tax=Microbispora catharanthi TaxID=1712871 RepID=A0A5N6BW02_9ACTN|nr:site-specific integrase [Microbispora catharanthi]KAB8184696.1 tyrosine-type recombinase/integrase [Microbispora catharanthi]
MGLRWDAVDLDAGTVRVERVAVEVAGTVTHKPYPSPRPAGGKSPFRPSSSNCSLCTEAVAHVAKHAAEGLRFHDLRHCYATWLVSDGVPVNDVARLLGHEQMSTTLNRYTHSSRDRYGRARAVFADFSLTSAPDLLQKPDNPPRR